MTRQAGKSAAMTFMVDYVTGVHLVGYALGDSAV